MNRLQDESWKPSVYKEHLKCQVKTFDEGRVRWGQFHSITYDSLLYFNLIKLDMDVYEKLLKESDELIKLRKLSQKNVSFSSPFDFSIDKFIVAKAEYIKRYYNEQLNNLVKQFLQL